MITFGLPRTFAIRVLPLQGGPEEGDPSARATWVALELWVNGQNLTAHTHETDQTVHSALHWPAIHLARWLVRSWQGFYETARWPRSAPPGVWLPQDLLRRWDRDIAENDPPDEELDSRDDFVATHFLQAGAAGGVVPDLCLSRDSDRIVVSWDNLQRAITDVTFHRPVGDAEVDARGFADTVEKFVDWVRDRLPAESADAKELEAWLEGFQAPETAWRMVRSFAGLDEDRARVIAPGPRDLSELFGLTQEWASDGAMARPELSTIAVAFRSLSPRIEPAELLTLRDRILSLAPNEAAFAAMDALVRGIPDPGGRLPDYEQGYALAESVRAEIGNAWDFLDVEGLVAKLGIAVEDVSLSDADLDGGAVCDGKHGPAIFVNTRSPRACVSWGRRMILAHELAHLLFDRRHAVPLAVISGPWAPVRLERRANAFAAELLLPKRALQRLARTYEEDELIEQAKLQYGVGIRMASWHVDNRLAA